MQYVFLVGGLGTRLGDKTKTTPKPLLSIGGQPFLKYLIDWADWGGADRILLLSGYLGGQIEEFAKKISTPKRPIEVIREDNPLGTGGSLLQAYNHLSEEFIVANGDSWLAMNPQDLITLKKSHVNQPMAMALRKIDDTSQSGVVITNDNKVVIDFKERGDGKPGAINAGIYVMERSLLKDYMDKKPPFSLERDIFPIWAQEKRITAQSYDGYFIDIGTPLNFEKADTSFKRAFNKFLL